jgi:hypothetical protein
MVVPSTKQSVKFRPFLVKEQRNLMVALESQDMKQILDATLQNIRSCVSDIDPLTLATFDVDYMFTQIRSKSVGETASVKVKCKKCESGHGIDIPLSQISLETETAKTIIPLSNELKIEMKYPTYNDMLKNAKILEEDVKYSDKMFEMIMLCSKGIYYEDEFHNFEEETRDEIEKFFNNLTGSQLDVITDFVEALPTIKYSQEWTCGECGEANVMQLEGLSDFFS